jgi:hypothetical protein
MTRFFGSWGHHRWLHPRRRLSPQRLHRRRSLLPPPHKLIQLRPATLHLLALRLDDLHLRPHPHSLDTLSRSGTGSFAVWSLVCPSGLRDLPQAALNRPLQVGERVVVRDWD